MRHGFSTERADADATAEAGRGPGRLDARMAAADYDDIKIAHVCCLVDDDGRFQIEWIADQLSIADLRISMAQSPIGNCSAIRSIRNLQSSLTYTESFEDMTQQVVAGALAGNFLQSLGGLLEIE